jgi:hypothetical protein
MRFPAHRVTWPCYIRGPCSHHRVWPAASRLPSSCRRAETSPGGRAVPDAGCRRLKGASCTLLTGVALGQRFSYQITQRGYYLLFAVSTTVSGQTVSKTVITGIPDAMRGTTGRFSAGDYQQDVQAAGSAGRVTFYGLQTEGGDQ